MLKAIPGVPRRLTRRLTGVAAEGLAAWLTAGEADPALGLGEELQRTLEHPWAFQQIQALGEELTIVELGGDDPGLRLTLARAGHRVISIGTVGTATSGTVVELDSAAVLGAGIPEGSIDVFASIGGLERLSGPGAAAVTEAGERLLRPGGHLVLTSRDDDVTSTLEAFGAELVAGDLVRSRGFVDVALVQGTTSGDVVAWCFVARKR